MTKVFYLVTIVTKEKFCYSIKILPEIGSSDIDLDLYENEAIEFLCLNI